MEQLAISKFKATCLAVLERVRKTQQPVRITRFGRPMAVIMPPAPLPKTGWVGSLAGTARITGDVVAPVTRDSDWDALR